MAEIKQKLVTPMVPNFIAVAARPGNKQDGLREAVTIPLGDLPNETLLQIADEWRDALLQRAQEQRDKK